MDGGIRALFEIERFHVKSWMVLGLCDDDGVSAELGSNIEVT